MCLLAVCVSLGRNVIPTSAHFTLGSSFLVYSESAALSPAAIPFLKSYVSLLDVSFLPSFSSNFYDFGSYVRSLSGLSLYKVLGGAQLHSSVRDTWGSMFFHLL